MPPRGWLQPLQAWADELHSMNYLTVTDTLFVTLAASAAEEMVTYWKMHTQCIIDQCRKASPPRTAAAMQVETAFKEWRPKAENECKQARQQEHFSVAEAYKAIRALYKRCVLAGATVLLEGGRRFDA